MITMTREKINLNFNFNTMLLISTAIYLIMPFAIYLLHNSIAITAIHFIAFNLTNYLFNVVSKKTDEKEYEFKKEKVNLIMMYSNIALMAIVGFYFVV